MSDRPNILFLMSDEHSFRFLSSRPYEEGGEPCHTPNLDALIAQGCNFDKTYCSMPLCTPSRMSLLCGRHTHRCGAWSNASVLDPEIPTFASHLGQHGYATATIGKMHLGGSLQHAGFQARPYGDFGGPCAHQSDPLDRLQVQETPGMAMRSRTVDVGISQIPESMLQEQVVTRESIAYLRQQRHAHPDQPWLLYASFSRPHFPLTAPRRFFERYYPEGVTPPRVGYTGDSVDHPMTLGAIKGFRTGEIGDKEMMKARAAYFACVDLLDEIIGDFLTVLQRDGLLDNTVIVYTADHGELAGEHGLFWKNTWHEAAVRVPFIFSLPEHRRGELASTKVTTPVSLADAFPTLCGLTGVPLGDGLDGVDLSTAIRGESCPLLEERPGIITESLPPRWGEGTEFRMIRSPRYKYVAFRGCKDLAFDLENDPDEQHNLLRDAGDDVPHELDDLRTHLMDNFDFNEVDKLRATHEALREKYPTRVKPRTPNQILRGDGRLVEADQPLYDSDVVSENMKADFEDFPDSTG